MSAEWDIEQSLRQYFPFGFQVSRKAWEWYDIASLRQAAEAIGAPVDVYSIRLLAMRLNEKHHRSSLAHSPVQAGQLLTAGVLNDILRYLVEYYCYEERLGVLPAALDWTARERGPKTVEQPPPTFVTLFPPKPVATGEAAAPEFLQSASQLAVGKTAANREVVSGEMILLSLATANPAFRPFRELFDDAELRQAAPYQPFIESLERYFDRQPPLAELGQTLFQALRAPMLASPDSLEGQLEYVKQHWAKLLPLGLQRRLAVMTDILEEEKRLRDFGPGQPQVLRFEQESLIAADPGYPEVEAFSQDADWMSNVVLLAKSVYVWLDQLTKTYGRPIRLLSDIPDEELDKLARWGLTGLWLIGLWQRSPASQKIKQIMGNPEAVSSAYSLFDYAIADDLGGEAAYQNLRERAGRRGIRLASDMVPNHTGLFSQWVIEHPDWFVQTSFPPFPVYQFTGPNLSEDGRLQLYLENGYWDRRDAAVVFKRVDGRTGETRYIYHGNDGTNMPWNDTAQLNFLLPAVREAVIQTVLHVARKFPIIRFDAAMTLAKRHYQRLWFPPPGEGGAIPSRADFGLTKEQFDAAFPKEFWREVVDRVTAEVPDTLLLAEAFWLMEGYFVRTLGMHRVYNSAFMNMLKLEENAKYRQSVKNVLEFSPEVLKRFVNFMNNPDEDTAVAQFGRDDKYFGVAMMMVTMPGLPMIGHGQVEGFTEKYGMEYRRAYWDEQPDDGLIRRHEQEIFPLLRRRRLFSGAENFALYDCHTPGGWIDENVFAYSNRYGEERALILYNNAYGTTAGWVHTSTPINVGAGDSKELVTRPLAEALALRTDADVFYAVRESKSGLRYLRAAKEIAERGWFASLPGYQYLAFLDWREIRDYDGSWGRLHERLRGAGVPDLEAAYREMLLDPLLLPFHAALRADQLRVWLDGDAEAAARLAEAAERFLRAAADFLHVAAERAPGRAEIERTLRLLVEARPATQPAAAAKPADGIAVSAEDPAAAPVLYVWLLVRRLGLWSAEADLQPADLARRRLDEWFLDKAIYWAFQDLSANPARARAGVLLVKLVTAHEALLAGEAAPGDAVPGDAVRALAWQKLLIDPAAAEFLRYNTYEGVRYFSRERFELLIATLARAARLVDPRQEPAAIAAGALQAADTAGYRLDELLLQLTADTAVDAE
ncbi:MAG: alpha-amylase [Myxococcales bacterium]|nr:alpha-amylase [Myxococcales bacterium]